MAPIGVKLCQNMFLTIIEKRLFLRSYDFLDVTIEFYAKNQSKYGDVQPSTTLGAGVKEMVSLFCRKFGPKMTFTKQMIYEKLR